MFQIKEKPIHPDYYKYPSSDGELMAETTLHAGWIVKIKENVDILTEGQDVFVASDLLWYPVEGSANICKAPDVMVVFGRPKGDRDSYLQWHENNQPPQVVFEIFSKSNHRRENKENLLEFYQKYGVEEYYSYDPLKNVLVIYQRQGDKFARLEGMARWTSPLLKIRFEWSNEGLQIFHPDDTLFVHLKELKKENTFLAKKADAEAKRANAETHRANAETQRADIEAERADAERKLRLMLADKLKQLGIDPDAL